MAIRKQINFDNGFSADYIRISNIYYVNGESRCTVTVQIWKDQDTREDSSKKPAQEFNLTIELGSGANIVERCYNGLKQLSDFDGSEDI